MRPTRILICAFAFLLGCGETALAPFGQLRSPVALALHEPTENLYIASLAGDDLRVFRARSETFLTAPVALFPLSIPTVRNPSALAAADRFVFVLSTAGAQVGFVDTQLQPGAAGPRSVDGPSGLPISLPLDMVPSALAAFASAYAWSPDGTLADHALVAGVDGASDGGVLLALRPPVMDGADVLDLPSPEALIELPGIYPTAIALGPQGGPVAGLVGPGGAPVTDCRTLAIADGRPEEEGGHVPAIWLTNVRVTADGILSIDELNPTRRIEIRVPVTLAGGVIEERVAPIRALAFAPFPMTDSLLAAVAADPCAERSGRIFAALDTSYCEGASSCPDVAVIDLSGDAEAPGTLAVDKISGGPALYDFPGAPLELVALPGPFNLPRAFDPVTFDDEGRGVPLADVPVVVLTASTDGNLYYLDGGMGSYLQAPGVRAEPEAAFPVDANRAGPGLLGAVARVDQAGRSGPAGLPTVEVPAGARPRNETWTAGFELALPGFANVGTVGGVAGGDVLPLAGGGGVALVADADPLQADRLVPRFIGDAICEGFPIVEVAADGTSVRFARDALQNDPACEQQDLPLDILPPIANPWTLSGDTTGFVGRIPGGSLEDRPTVEVFSGSQRLFLFTPAEADVPRGATYTFQTSDGFAFYGFQSNALGLLPAAVQPFLVNGPRAGRDPSWRVFVAYSGSDSLLAVDPVVPQPGRLPAFQ